MLAKFQSLLQRIIQTILTSQVLHKGIGMKINSDYIKLDSFLKAVNEAASGGEAKIFIAEGLVRVNGEPESRRGRKLRPGDSVEIDGRSYPVEEGDE